MRLGIIGHPCIDEVVLAGRNAQDPVRSLGGIFYSYAAMERLMIDLGSFDDRFLSLTWLSESDRSLLEPFLTRLQRVDMRSGLWPTTSLTNRVQLVYPEHGERTEHCPNVLPPLSTNELTPQLVSSIDGLFVNMISGFDLTIDTLEVALQNASKKPFVHLDVHALILGDLSIGEESRFGSGRKPKGVTDSKRWLSAIDSVQLNELEMRWFGDPEITNEEALLHYLSAQAQRPKYVIITRAARGATLYDLTADAVHHIPAPSVKVINPTGSGDVFGATFIFALLKNHEPAEAVRTAVEWATWCATLNTLEEILTAPKM